MKRKILAVTILAVALLLGACQSSAPAAENTTAKEASGLGERTYIAGLDDTFMPMGFRDDKGELVGFDIDLAKEAAKRMGITIDFLPIDWDVKEAELDAGNIDFIWNGFSITPEREEKILFSKPYLDNRQIIVTLADSPVKTKADLAGKSVSVQGESSALEAVQKDTAFVESLDGGALIEFPTNVECFKDLEATRSDAVVADEVLARDYMKRNGEEKYRVLDEDFGEEEFAVGMRLSDTALKEALDKALDDMKADGTYDTIKAKWLSEN